MNQRELGELRRRFRPEKSAISRVYGCYVNSSREIIAYIDQSLGMTTQEETEKYLGLLKKALSGTLGRNLIDIVFSTRQVADSEEHRLLTALRDCQLKDSALRQSFYEKLIGTLELEESNYLILLAHDVYDVPHRAKDDTVDGSDTVFSYFVCCVCPVKEGKPELGYFSGDNEFHTCTPCLVVAPPELGFLFPAFDDLTANLYNALFYSRKPDAIHQEFIDAVFRTEPPMSAAEQRETFETILSESLGDACTLQLARNLYEWVRDKVEEHKESREEEPLAVTAADLTAVLLDSQVPEAQVQAFAARFAESFGASAAMNPANLINTGRFELEAGDGAAKVTLAPEQGGRIETTEIDGRKYLLIPAEGLYANGLPVQA